MFSSAYPSPSYPSISPTVSEKVNEYLVTFNRLHKLLIELFEKVSTIHTTAANEMLAMVDTCQKKMSDVTKGMTTATSVSILGFITKFLHQVDKQAKTLKALQVSLQDTVVNPLREAVHTKKEMWKTCFHYADNFTQQICKKETALHKCYKQYSEAATKVKPGNQMEKQLQLFQDLHNTYILKLSSLNSMNKVLYAHALPHIVTCIEEHHGELNNKYRHHVSNLFYLHTQSYSCMVGCYEGEMHTALDNLNVLQDLQNFVHITCESVKDRHPPIVHFSVPKVDDPKTSIFGNLPPTFILNERTRPNLQRRLASLQQQTQVLVDEISAKRSADNDELSADEYSVNKLVDFLRVCDKEANLNVFLKQVELYTPDVISFLGPIPLNVLSENKHSKNKPSEDSVFGGGSSAYRGETRPHEFVEPRIMKPISCFYCEKLIPLIGKGYICKVCKVSVHKKCATSVKFCEPLLQTQRTPTAPPESVSGSPHKIPDSPIQMSDSIRNSFVSDLIDLESDDDFYDQSEFDDGFSEESDTGYDSYSIISGKTEFPGSFNSTTSDTQAPITTNNFLLELSEMCRTQPSQITSNDDAPLFDPHTRNQNGLSGLPGNEFTGISGNGFTSFSVNGFTGLSVNGFSGGVKPEPLYDEVTPDIHITTLNNSSREIHEKPIVVKKPILNQSTRPVLPTKPLVDTKMTVPCSKPSIASKPPVIPPKPTIKNIPLSHKPPITSPKPPVPKKPSMNTVPLTAHKPPKTICVALYDFRGTNDTHLHFLAGNKIEISQKSGPEWWHGEINGCRGYFPAQYVMEVDEGDCLYRMLYDFTGEGEGEMDVHEGDIVVLVEDRFDWLLVRSQNGEGLVPKSYVEDL